MSGQQNQQTNLKPIMPKKVGMPMPMKKVKKVKSKKKANLSPSFAKVSKSIAKTMGK